MWVGTALSADWMRPLRLPQFSAVASRGQ